MAWPPSAAHSRESSLLTASCFRFFSLWQSAQHTVIFFDNLLSAQPTVIIMSVRVGVCFVVSLTVDIILIFLSTISVVEFDEIRTTKKSPIEQCDFLNPLVSNCMCQKYLLYFLTCCRCYQNTSSRLWSASSSFLWLIGFHVCSTLHYWLTIFTGIYSFCPVIFHMSCFNRNSRFGTLDITLALNIHLYLFPGIGGDRWWVVPVSMIQHQSSISKTSGDVKWRAGQSWPSIF